MVHNMVTRAQSLLAIAFLVLIALLVGPKNAEAQGQPFDPYCPRTQTCPAPRMDGGEVVPVILTETVSVTVADGPCASVLEPCPQPRMTLADYTLAARSVVTKVSYVIQSSIADALGLPHRMLVLAECGSCWTLSGGRTDGDYGLAWPDRIG